MNIFPLFSIEFLFEAVKFLTFLTISLSLGVFVAKTLLSKRYLENDPLGVLAFSFVFSVVIFSGSGYLFGYLGLRWLSWLFPLMGAVSLILQRDMLVGLLKAARMQLIQFDKTILLLLVIGVAMQLVVVATSGFRQSEGIIYHRLNSVDGLLHLGFAEFSKDNFPPVQPGAAGLLVTNYHYWSDLYLSDASRLFFLSVNHLYFQFLPFVIALSIPTLLISLIKMLNGSVVTQRWVLFFHFFAGNSAHIFAKLFTGKLAWNLPAIDHGVLQFLNMPQAFARMTLVAAVILFLMFVRKGRLKFGVAMALLFASLFGFKVYWGIFAVVGYSLYLLLQIFVGFVHSLKKQRIVAPLNLIKHLFCYLIFGVVSLAVFLPPNKDAGGLFLAPFAWPKILLGAQNLDWNEWWLRLQVYEEAGNVKALVVWFGMATAIFLTAMYGTRLLGLVPPVQWLKKNKVQNAFLVFVWPATLAFTVLGMNVLQSSGGANVFNFFIVSLWVGGLLLPFNLEWIKTKVPKLAYITLSVLIIALSVPRPLQDAYLFIRSTIFFEESMILSQAEEEALTYLRENTEKNAVVQAHNKLRHDNYETPYVSLFSKRQSYMAGSNILLSHNQPVEQRMENVEFLFATASSSAVAAKMMEYGIDYLYILHEPNQVFNIDTGPKAHLSPVFSNSKATIWGLTEFAREL